MIADEEAGKIGRNAFIFTANASRAQQISRPAPPHPHGRAHIRAKQVFAQPDFCHNDGSVKNEKEQSPEKSQVFHGAKIKKAPLETAPCKSAGQFDYFLFLQVGAGATVAAMAGFEEEKGSEKCESEKLLPVFH